MLRLGFGEIVDTGEGEAYDGGGLVTNDGGGVVLVGLAGPSTCKAVAGFGSVAMDGVAAAGADGMVLSTIWISSSSP